MHGVIIYICVFYDGASQSYHGFGDWIRFLGREVSGSPERRHSEAAETLREIWGLVPSRVSQRRLNTPTPACFFCYET